MSDKTRPRQGGTGSQPEKHRLRAGAKDLLPSLKNLAKAGAGAGLGNNEWPNFSKKAKRR
jgi:hypothetical protein